MHRSLERGQIGSHLVATTSDQNELHARDRFCERFGQSSTGIVFKGVLMHLNRLCNCAGDGRLRFMMRTPRAIVIEQILCLD